MTNPSQKTEEVKGTTEIYPHGEVFEVLWWFEMNLISVVEAAELLGLETVGEFWRLYDTERSKIVKHILHCRERDRQEQQPVVVQLLQKKREASEAGRQAERSEAQPIDPSEALTVREAQASGHF